MPGLGRFRDVHEERLTHRLEAFSDIVLGFSLAEMTLNFVIPAHAIDVYRDPVALIAFAFTFLTVALVWYVHHRLFEYFFVPRPLPMTLNFVGLALVVWLVYELQLYVHFAPTADHKIAAIGYTLTFSVLWMLFCANFVACVAGRWRDMDVPERRNAVISIGRTGAVGFGTFATICALYANGLPPELAFWAIWIWAIAWRALSPLVLRRIA